MAAWLFLKYLYLTRPRLRSLIFDLVDAQSLGQPLFPLHDGSGVGNRHIRCVGLWRYLIFIGVKREGSK